MGRLLQVMSREPNGPLDELQHVTDGYWLRPSHKQQTFRAHEDKERWSSPLREIQAPSPLQTYSAQNQRAPGSKLAEMSDTQWSVSYQHH